MPRTSHRSNCRLTAFALMLLSSLGGVAMAEVVEPVGANENWSSDDPVFQTQLTDLREKYDQDRQALKARSSQLAPDERMRLHRALLDSHRTALTKLETDAKQRTSNSKARWEKRRNERSERMEEVRKDRAARKQRHKQDND